jgi:hypothetical protein
MEFTHNLLQLAAHHVQPYAYHEGSDEVEGDVETVI